MNKSYASTLSSSAVSKLTPRTSKKRKRQTATGDERAKEQHHQVQVEKKHNSNTNSSSSSSSKKRNVAKPLNGIILSVSTLDVKDKKHSSTDSSFSAVSALCLELGAKVSPQVHRKVFAVICNQSAVTQLTQRVRKAINKKFSLLIDVEWLRQCKIQRCRVNHEEFLLTDLALMAMEKRSSANKSERAVRGSETEVTIPEKCSGGGGGYDEDEMLVHLKEGWSEPVALDCCCVCHETNRDDCKWCVDCNVTLARKNRSSEQT